MNKRSTKYDYCSLVNHADQTRIAHVEPQTCRERCHLLNYHRDCSGDAVSSISLSICLSFTCLLLTSTCPLIRNVTHCIAQYAGGNSDDLHAAGEIEAQVTSWRRWRLQKKVSSAVAARTHTHTQHKNARRPTASPHLEASKLTTAAGEPAPQTDQQVLPRAPTERARYSAPCGRYPIGLRPGRTDRLSMACAANSRACGLT